MFFLKKRCKLIETDFFSGLIDHHSHILAGVDDGLKSVEESLVALEHYDSMGVNRVLLTPHINNATTPEQLATMDERFATLKSLYKGGVELRLAGEYMIDTGFEERMESGLRYISSERVLVETSYFSAPNNLYDVLYNISSRGDTPIIAHPERYIYMSSRAYNRLKDRGYELQLNLLSLAGHYGRSAYEKAMYLLRNGLYDVVGSDLHQTGLFIDGINRIKLELKDIEILQQLKEKKE